MAFDWQVYLNNYADLRAAGLKTEHDALNHWLTCGQNEGRTYETITDVYPLDWKMYLDTYPDLRNAGITTDHEAALHWIQYGFAESRKVFPKHTLDLPRVIKATTIPKVIYQTWPSLDLPPDVANAVLQVQDANRQFEHHIYDNTTRREFIKEHFPPPVLYAYDSLTPGVYKTDLWAYCILYLRGGIYLDINAVPIDGFSFNSIVECDDYFCSDNGVVNNAIMICLPGNTIMKSCIETIYKNVLTRAYGSSELEPTGSHLISKFIAAEDCAMEYSNKVVSITDIKLLHIPNKLQGVKEWHNKQIYEDLEIASYL